MNFNINIGQYVVGNDLFTVGIVTKIVNNKKVVVLWANGDGNGSVPFFSSEDTEDLSPVDPIKEGYEVNKFELSTLILCVTNRRMFDEIWGQLRTM